MRKKITTIIYLLFLISQAAYATTNLEQLKKRGELHEGFVGYAFDSNQDKLYLKINNIDTDFLYQTSLPQGLGSNDIGLDRGQLGQTHLAKFERVGNKLLLIAQNTKYRAVSENQQERDSVEEAFASSVLWVFPIVDSNPKWVLVDASGFILQDIHGVARALERRKQGSFKLDKSRSTIYLARTKAFPDNTELEARITFTGNKPGKFVQQAAIAPNVLSLKMHHSFIRLPDNNFVSRVFHPQSGFWSFSYQDYAQPINRPITQRTIPRHRLQKKKPDAKISEAVEPIVYYLDPGAPEPVKTALIDGASWWNQAFESIGYSNAFQVKILPDDIDPMDIRYNVIQWVHRATRGWSYGSSVIDPRTGEIIKGHVTLGSLRVRQDYLIAQGMLSRFDKTNDDKEMMSLALARIRQLAAHEVGHTLGLAHNFAASTFGRASVMDYPHPVFKISNDKISGESMITADAPYAENIGVWDKAVIAYGYQDDGSKQALNKILANNKKAGMVFISDPDARRISNGHATASLWDNGSNVLDELKRMIKVRQLALDKFGLASLHSGRPLSDLQEILVPVYYSHRYQAAATAKWIGGSHYQYSTKSESSKYSLVAVSGDEQSAAISTILETLSPAFLMISDPLNHLLLPKAYGYSKSRESLPGRTGVLFDRVELAAASIQHSLSLLFNSTRLERVIQQNAEDNSIPSISMLGERLHKALWRNRYLGTQQLINQRAIDLSYSNLLNLLHTETVSVSVKSQVLQILEDEKKYLAKALKRRKSSSVQNAFLKYQLKRLDNLNITNLKKEQLIKLPKMPPGSPI